MANWAERIEGETLVVADAHRESWTTEDVDFVRTFTDDATDEEIAYALGRSLYAIWAIQTRIRSGEFEASRVRRIDPRKIERSYDYVTTFPPGYFD